MEHLSKMAEELTNEELQEIAEYTIQKILSYPKRLGKTVENYFDLLYPDEIKSYLMSRAVNRESIQRLNA